MSDREKSEEEEDSKTYQISVGSDELLEKRTTDQLSECKSVIINVHSSNCSKRTDKLIQTEGVSSANLSEIEAETEERVVEEKKSVEGKVASTGIREHNLKNRERKLTPIIIRKLARSMSEEKKDEKPMDNRRPNSDLKSSKGLPSAKQASDLERKKMQAELKAAEEIARIKQNLIEKRLALELAIIDDGIESPHKIPTPRPSHQAELRALEEIALRKQSLIETNLAQELESLDYQTRIMPPPRPLASQPPPPPPQPQLLLPPPQRQSSPHTAKNPFRTDSTSSVMNSLRGLPKLNLDRKFSGDSGQKSPNPLGYVMTCVNDRRYQEPRREERYSNYPARPEFAYNYAPPRDYSKARSTWKSAMAKIKKKMKSKPSSNWDED